RLPPSSSTPLERTSVMLRLWGPDSPLESEALWHLPPSETPRDLADFQSRHGEAPRFAGKGRGNCTWSMPDGTMRRSFSRTAAGQLAEGGRVDPTPRQGGAMTPPSKTRTPSGPPLVLPAIGAAHVHRTVHFA